MSSKRAPDILKILFQPRYINIFVLRVSFLVDIFNKKTPFLTKKTSAVKSETQYRSEAIEN